MKAILPYAFGISLTLACVAASAEPMFSVTGGSGLPGSLVVVSLKDLTTDGSTDGLFGFSVLVQFDPSRLSYVSPASFEIRPDGSVVEVDRQAEQFGQVSVGIAPILQNGLGVSLLDLGFEILSGADRLTEVTFTCLPPPTPGVPPVDVSEVKDQATANTYCRPVDQDTGEMSLDYAIPPTKGFVNVLAQSSPVPVSSTASLALLGIGLMGWMRWRQEKQR